MSGAVTHTTDLAAVTNILFTPGDRPERFEKGLHARPQALVLDLEDAVDSTRKDLARQEVTHWLTARSRSAPPETRVGIRINGLESRHHAADLAAVGRCITTGFGPDFLLLPKVESGTSVARILALLPIETRSVPPLIAAIESALGLEQVIEIVRSSPHVRALAFGAADYCLDIGCQFSWEPLLYARSRIVHAAALARIAAYDVPFLDVSDDLGLERETLRAKALGFTGKFAIHPRQVPILQNCFLPTQFEIERALAVIAAANQSGAAAQLLDGIMVDAPIIAAARQTLARAQAPFTTLPGAQP